MLCILLGRTHAIGVPFTTPAPSESHAKDDPKTTTNEDPNYDARTKRPTHDLKRRRAKTACFLTSMGRNPVSVESLKW
jgi:hypothetical protein